MGGRRNASPTGLVQIPWVVRRGGFGAGRLFSDSPVACDLTPCPYEVGIYPVGRCGVGMRVRGVRKRQEQARLLATSDALRGWGNPWSVRRFLPKQTLYICRDRRPRLSEKTIPFAHTFPWFLHRGDASAVCLCTTSSVSGADSFSIPRRSLFVCIRTLLVQIPWSVLRVDASAEGFVGGRRNAYPTGLG